MNVYFLTPLSAFYEYSRNGKRVLRELAREPHAPIERLGSTRNQYGDLWRRIIDRAERV